MDNKIKKIALLTGGGDCPGLNAVIRAITRAAILNYGIEVIGYKFGYKGLYHNNFIPLTMETVTGILHRGGTILYSSNKDNLFDYTVERNGVISKEDVSDVAIENIELKENYGNYKVLVPGKSLNEISKILNGGVDDDVNIYFTSNHILFEFDDTNVVSRLIESTNFFDTDKMISNDYKTRITINKKEMADCIDRATLLIKEGDKKPVFLSMKDTEMELTINTFIGSMDESIPITKDGDDLLISFNPKFLIDILKVLDQEEVSMFFTNPKAPCFIKDEEGSDIYIVLPVVQ